MKRITNFQCIIFIQSNVEIPMKKKELVLDGQSNLLWFLTNGLIEIISLNSLFLINFGQLMKVFNDKVIQI